MRNAFFAIMVLSVLYFFYPASLKDNETFKTLEDSQKLLVIDCYDRTNFGASSVISFFEMPEKYRVVMHLDTANLIRCDFDKPTKKMLSAWLIKQGEPFKSF